jgi:hypothetical protein
LDDEPLFHDLDDATFADFEPRTEPTARGSKTRMGNGLIFLEWVDDVLCAADRIVDLLCFSSMHEWGSGAVTFPTRSLSIYDIGLLPGAVFVFCVPRKDSVTFGGK